jgi:CheY-like chemotaxis protein
VRSALIDISEKKQFEQQLIEQKNKAEEMNALKSSFLKNMSHELRTPLIGILGYSEVLAEQLPEGESLEKIKTINRSGTRLLHTLNSILDLSRIEANKMEIKKVRINIIDIISDSIELFDVKAKAKHLSLIPQFEEMNIELELDRLIFANILDNLLSNAIKYTNSGHISVRVQRRVVKERPHCAIEIADTGIGINEGDIDYIFDEFRQVSEGYGRKYEGTGLGLTLTKKFVQLLGGEISVKSEVNKGSVFTLIFPMIADQDQMTTDGKADDKMALPLALLIDDDEATCEIGKFILSPKLETDTAENGAEALSKLQLKQYSVILLDINLGRGMNGIEVLHELRKMEWYRTAPIIAMTAYAMVGDKERFIAEGFDYYLAKPFSREEMMKVVAKACECINK